MISAVHCAFSQLPETCDLSGRFEYADLVVLDVGLVLVAKLTVKVVFCAVVVDMVGSVEGNTKLEPFGLAAGLCDVVVDTPRAGRLEGGATLKLLELVDDGKALWTVDTLAGEEVLVEVVELDPGGGPLGSTHGVPSAFLHSNEAYGAGIATAAPAKWHTRNSNDDGIMENSSCRVW